MCHTPGVWHMKIVPQLGEMAVPGTSRVDVYEEI